MRMISATCEEAPKALYGLSAFKSACNASRTGRLRRLMRTFSHLLNKRRDNSEPLYAAQYSDRL